MNREDETIDNDLIDLGSVIEETKGGTIGAEDHPGLRVATGLSEVD